MARWPTSTDSGEPIVDQFVHGRSEGPIRIGVSGIGGELSRVARAQTRHRLPELRRHPAALGRALRSLRRLEQPRGGGHGCGPRAVARRVGRAAWSWCRSTGDSRPLARIATGMPELDRVLGGGLVPGSALLIGGDPGIGKSTLMLQAAASLARRGIGGRLCQWRGGHRPDPPAGDSNGADGRAGQTGGERRDRRDAGSARRAEGAQTCWWSIRSRPCMSRSSSQSPGSVTQLRASAEALIRFAKRRGTVVLLIGHVTKDGQIAGPRVLEHMVDAVVVFRGRAWPPVPHPACRQEPLRTRQRDRRVRDAGAGAGAGRQSFGAVPVGRTNPVCRARSVFAGMEGTRPVLVEIQALVARACPARRAVPWSAGIPVGSPCCWPSWRAAVAL